MLAASGVSPKVAQEIMRHGDINLTMSLYTHTFREQESQAVEKLPDLTLPSIASQNAVKTGTSDTDDFLLKSCFQDGQKRTETDSGGQELAIAAQNQPVEPSYPANIASIYRW